MTRRNARAHARTVRGSILALAVAAAGPSLLSPHWASGGTFTWDNNPASAGAQDGAGTWDPTNAALTNFTDGVSNFVWNNSNNDTAVFGSGATGGAITVATTINLGGLTLNNNGYNFSGSALNVGGPSPVVFSINGNGTISSTLSGTGPIDFVINPANTLTMPGTNMTFTNGWTLDGGGTLNLNAKPLTVSGGPITLNSGTLIVNDTAAVSASLTINGTNTAMLMSSGNATFSGNAGGSGTLMLFSKTTNNTISLNGNNGTFTGTFLVGVPGSGTLTNLRFTANSAGSSAATFNLQNDGTILSRVASGTIQLGALMGQVGSHITGPASAGSIDYEIGGAGISTQFDGIIQNAASNETIRISKIGNDSLTLTASNTYTGNTVINGGTLAFTNGAAASASPSIAVNVGTFTFAGALNVSGVSGGYTIPAGQTLTGSGGTVYGTVNVTNPTGVVNPGTTPSGSGNAGTLSFHDTLNLNGGTLVFDLSNSTGSGNDALTVGSLELSASSKLFVNPIGTFSTGTYNLINYTGLSGSLANLTLASGAPITAQLITSNPGVVQLDVLSLGAASNIRWNGPGNVWDVGTTANFFNTTTSAAAPFFQGDNVTFDDTAGVPSSISFSGAITPSSLHFTNNVNSYAFSGSGGLAGNLTLVMDGTGSVSFSNANNHSGGTVINAGSLRVSNPAALGTATSTSQSAPITLNGGTLGIDGGITFGGIIGTTPNQLQTNPISITAANSTISGNGTLGSFVQAFDGGGNPLPWRLDISSGNTISVTANTFLNDFAGATISLGASNGTLRYTGTAAIATSNFIDLGTGSATLMTREGNTTTLGGIAGGPNTSIRGAGSASAATVYNVGQAGTNPSPTGTNTFAGSIANGTGGSGATITINKFGPQWTLVLSGNNSYTGSTTINAGTLEVDGTHSGGGTYNLLGGALTGTGVISARVTSSGGVIQPGNAANPTGALTVGTLDLSGANLAFNIGGGSASKINVTNANGLLNAGANLSLTDLGGSTYGRYTLIDYAGTPLTDLTSFNPTSFSAGTLSGNLVNNTFNTSVDLFFPNPAAHDSTWSGSSSNQWTASATGNWTNGFVPGVADDFATFTDTGAGTVNLTSPETVAQIVFATSAGSYNISGSTLSLDASGGYVNINVLGGTQTISAPMVFGKQSFLGVDTPATLVLSGAISGSNSITKAGAGTLVLSGNNTFTGPVTLNSGTLVASSSTSVGDGSSTNTLNLGGGTLVVTGAFNSPSSRTVRLLADSDIEHAGNTVDIEGVVSGGGKLTTTGTGSTVLGAANTFTGGLVVNNGTAQGLTPTSIGTGRITLNSAEVIVPGSQSYGNAITVSGGSTIALGGEGQGTLSGAITDGGSAWTIIPGTTSPQTVNFTTTTVGTLTTGTATIGNAGTIRLIGTSGAFNISSLTVNVGTAGGFLMNRDGGLGSVQLGGIAGDTSATIRGAGSSAGTTNYHIGYNNVDNTFFGTIANGTTGNLALTKEGTASLTLPGTLTYTGGTTVVSGALKVNKMAPGTVAVSAGSLQVLAKGTANDPSGTSVITAAPTITAGALLDVTNNETVIDYTTLGTQLNTLQTAIGTGSLTSSTATGGLVLGFADASAVGRTTFGGVTLDGTAIVMGLTNRGDATMDGTVNALDFNALATNFGAATGGVWQQGDFNYDGAVNTTDFMFLAQNFGKTVSLPAPPVLGSLVPEPASLGVLAMFGLLGRRRRRD